MAQNNYPHTYCSKSLFCAETTFWEGSSLFSGICRICSKARSTPTCSKMQKKRKEFPSRCGAQMAFSTRTTHSLKTHQNKTMTMVYYNNNKKALRKANVAFEFVAKIKFQIQHLSTKKKRWGTEGSSILSVFSHASRLLDYQNSQWQVKRHKSLV